ncbi:MAG: hypothetical protein HYW51_01760 [Candidatus Doudnabacteria bacterium]|nr:hypothetical protein [Candidatus Doudnabacteria bacterium]
MRQSEYAQAGVDYTQIQGFKDAMVEVGKKTLAFPNRRGVYVEQDVMHSHGVVYYYHGPARTHRWAKTQEGLGNKNWIAEWMYQFSGTGRTYYEGIGIDTARMAVNDNIAQGAMPAVYTDEVAAGPSSWFSDRRRAADLANGFFRACEEDGMALGAGESPALKYLINALPPVTSAPSLSGSVTGIIAPASRLITGKKLRAGDKIIGVPSSGLQANGISLVIRRTMGDPSAGIPPLKDGFLTKLPNGNTLGEEALIPTRSYVAFVEALQEADVEIHALLPGTGDGVAKLAFDKRPFTYRVHTWTPNIPLLFLFMRELGVSLEDCLKTFNWGIGLYAFVPPNEVDHVIQIGRDIGDEVLEVGVVEQGERMTIFGPANDLKLPPPGE